MEKKLAFLFPGQGSQYVGMGKEFFDRFAVAKETFEEADEKLGRPLSRLIFEGPATDLTLTKNSQIAIYVVSVAIWRVLQQQFEGIKPAVCAGLSLGEYSALTGAERLMFTDGIDLVQARGLYMHQASVRHPGTMAVCLNMPLKLVEEIVAEVHAEHPVWVANLNCPGQVVISGTREGVKLAGEKLKLKGAKRVLSLDVSGAFHSGLMEEAKQELEKKLAMVPIHDSKIDVVLNVPGDFVHSAAEIRQFLIDQVVSPVLWEKGVRKMDEEGIDLYIEIGCGKSLNGMNRKIGVKGSTLSVEKVEDLEEVAKALDLALV
ncbi:ACP S-malonyltransferase [Simkania negevensis]|uniref:Malonyl CoA-acyl carrier protein transacylase n=1 Tax=Simkania negevensis (strain ATCC VR-1471 / DSM 27360 / Z) TaxID=331113 RepID=F8L7G7_SIMNZ|nr:ACP S-malonyltransferase [Simkania negevensis]MCB1068600.1 ACP S-malonyltransferase [Simkania sp.]MCB1075202.1 ACP S-malonyltransferase [Simkania sp.]MCP5491176.1 ACP S-malonyltransferase [Chlamydiales bacterium]CCB88700.1 malonyl CoA-acyl carrier protein transacylase [Simkania negevensis Z]